MHGKRVAVSEESSQEALPVSLINVGPATDWKGAYPFLKQMSWLPRLHLELFASQWYRKGRTPQTIGSSSLRVKY